MNNLFIGSIRDVLRRCLRGYLVLLRAIAIFLRYTIVVIVLAVCTSLPIWWLATRYSTLYSLALLIVLTLLALLLAFGKKSQINKRIKNVLLALPVFLIIFIPIAPWLTILPAVYLLFICGFLLGKR